MNRAAISFLSSLAGIVVLAFGLLVGEPCHASPFNEKPTSYSQYLDSLDQRIASFEKLASKRENDWVVRDRLAGLLIERGKLSGRLDDLARAEKVLTDAFSIAPNGGGPLLTAARLNYSLHRLDRASHFLDEIGQQALMKSDSQLAITALRSNIQFQRGEYAQARDGYRSCERASPGACLTDLAIYYQHTGGYVEADALYRRALSERGARDPQRRSWLLLQIGILYMGQGRYEEALEVLKEADQSFSNWWLVREHIAEILTINGSLTEAITIYKEVIKETDLPQYTQALSDIYEKQKEMAQAKELRAHAEQAWSQQIALFPEAAGGHALEHFLDVAGEEDRALKLAQDNFKARPAAPARIFMAEALLKKGLAKQANAEVAQALSTSFRSAELYDLASRTAIAMGETTQGANYRKACLAINPNFYGTE